MILFSLAFADPMVDALVAELERSQQLSLPAAPPLYHLRYHLADLDQRGVYASFGTLIVEDHDPYHALGVELRVGDPSYDNTGFGGWENGFLRSGLGEQLSPLDLRQSAWRLTDRAYKQAVEQYARKTSQFAAPPDYPGDYVLSGPVVEEGPSPDLTGDPTELAVRLSNVFRPAGAKLLHGDVHLGQEAGHVWVVDTEGTRLRRPMQEVSLRAIASLRTDDGMLLTDSRLYTARETLPDEAKMVAELTAMRDDLVSRASTARLEEEYVGPIVFEADAAIDLYRYLLVPQLEGTPEEIPFDSWFGEMGEQKATVRVGRRVLPEGWRAVDDPTADPSHPSSFTFDQEGSRAERTELIDDGIVNDLLMSRVPRKGLKPNGHARGPLGERASGRVAQLTVDPGKHDATKKLYKRALKMAAAYDKDHVFIVRRLQEPSVLGQHRAGMHALMGDGDDRAKLPPPVELIRRYRDGREERVHGARFAFSDRFILRDIALAGPQRHGTFMAPFAGSYVYLGPTEGMPTKISGPDVLVREIELAPIAADPRDKPVLEPPE